MSCRPNRVLCNCEACERQVWRDSFTGATAAAVARELRGMDRDDRYELLLEIAAQLLLEAVGDEADAALAGGLLVAASEGAFEVAQAVQRLRLAVTAPTTREGAPDADF